jgi:hypothetical protein
VVEAEGGPHPLQPADVEVDPSAPDVAAAGKGHPGPAGPSQDGPQHQDGRAHPADQVVRGLHAQEAGGVDGHRAALALHPDPQAGEHLHHGPAVGDVGHVAEDRPALGQEGRGHELQGGVLGARDPDLAGQTAPPGNQEPVHDRKIVRADPGAAT